MEEVLNKVSELLDKSKNKFLEKEIKLWLTEVDSVDLVVETKCKT